MKKGKYSANKHDLDIETIKQKLCAQCARADEETVVSLYPEPAAARLSGQVSTCKQ